ncbi:hypothetical protein [Rhizobium bangladeshense]|uniref:hypothetical protein n=1 Tax=Rhizobium bangladeshense TaxID=1138189 RepID=UPI0012E95DCB|nr:hypothetical protein [Rhizobium bangladeshense]
MPNNPDWWKWVRLAFQRFALSQAGNPETGDELIIDTAHPRKLLQLNFADRKSPSSGYAATTITTASIELPAENEPVHPASLTMP